MFPETETERVAGVDGCRGGWVASSAEDPILFFKTFEEILEQYKKRIILVDLPLGLPQTKRDLDRSARENFDVQPSSLFSVPCRDAIYARSYEEACELNEKKTGKKISKQVWNIGPKIREVDSCLRTSSELGKYVFESHPEVCFSILKGGRLNFSKKKPEGIEERLNLLEKHDSSARYRFNQALTTFPRLVMARDDVVDALVLGLAATNFTIFQYGITNDDYGLPIRLAIPNLQPREKSANVSAPSCC